MNTKTIHPSINSRTILLLGLMPFLTYCSNCTSKDGESEPSTNTTESKTEKSGGGGGSDIENTINEMKQILEKSLKEEQEKIFLSLKDNPHQTEAGKKDAEKSISSKIAAFNSNQKAVFDYLLAILDKKQEEFIDRFAEVTGGEEIFNTIFHNIKSVDDCIEIFRSKKETALYFEWLKKYLEQAIITPLIQAKAEQEARKK